jgi:hypothetical protein
MAFRVHISNEGGVGISGTIYFYDANGLQLGAYDIPVEGADVPADWVTIASTFQVSSPGYVGYAVLSLGELNNFTLVRDNSSKVIMYVLLLIGLLVAGKFIKG